MATPPMRSAALGRARLSPSSIRRISKSRPTNAQVQQPPTAPSPPRTLPPPTNLALRKPSNAFFDTTGVLWAGFGADNPKDPNKAELGKTLRILQERLPTLLQYPLPQEILAPNISLHLFPSTHPHLPTVSGRVAYSAALWTSPIAWNRVPIVGNVRLEVLAERMTSEPLTFLPRRDGAMPEQLVVRWCEERKGKKGTPAAAASWQKKTTFRLARGVEPHKAFTGLFIFDFDSEGRVLSHTIEQAHCGRNWENGVGAKFVGLTDWLLGGIKEGGHSPAPAFSKLNKDG